MRLEILSSTLTFKKFLFHNVITSLGKCETQFYQINDIHDKKFRLRSANARRTHTGLLRRLSSLLCPATDNPLDCSLFPDLIVIILLDAKPS